MSAKNGTFKHTCGSDELCRWSDDGKKILRVIDSQPHICPDGSTTDLAVKSQIPEVAADAPPYAKLHSEIWKFSIENAKQIHPGTDAESIKKRDILAQVFYKKCFDAKIHGVAA